MTDDIIDDEDCSVPFDCRMIQSQNAELQKRLSERLGAEYRTDQNINEILSKLDHVHSISQDDAKIALLQYENKQLRRMLFCLQVAFWLMTFAWIMAYIT